MKSISKLLTIAAVLVFMLSSCQQEAKGPAPLSAENLPDGTIFVSYDLLTA